MKETKITFLSGKYRSSSVVSSQAVQKPTDIQIHNFGLHLQMPSVGSSDPQAMEYPLYP